MKPITVIFIGRSGSGKGTQARMLEDYIRDNDSQNLPVLYLETGKAFREFIKGSSLGSELANKRVATGERQPDFLAIWMWAHTVVLTLEAEMHLIVDGTPRSLPEAEILQTALDFYVRQDVHIIYLQVSREWSINHLRNRGRADDINMSSIEQRMSWFDDQVMPAVEFFKASGKVNFSEISAEQNIEQVHADIMKKVFGIEEKVEA